MYDKYSKVSPLTTNQFVSGSKGLMITNRDTSDAQPIDLYAYISTGITTSVTIQVPFSSTQILPIKLAGVSFSSGNLTVLSLS